MSEKFYGSKCPIFYCDWMPDEFAGVISADDIDTERFNCVAYAYRMAGHDPVNVMARYNDLLSEVAYLVNAARQAGSGDKTPASGAAVTSRVDVDGPILRCGDPEKF